MSYAETVRRTVPDASDALLTFAAELERAQMPFGCSLEEARGFAPNADELLAVLRTNGLLSANDDGPLELLDPPPVRVPDDPVPSEPVGPQVPKTDAPPAPVPPERAKPASPKPAKRSARKPVPRTGVKTRAPVDQNDYTMCVVNSKQLRGNAKLAAMVAAVEIGIEAYRRSRPFASLREELSAVYMADKMGVSLPTATKAMETVVIAGFLERLDNGEGGPQGKNIATYRASVPAYMRAPERN